MIIKGFLLVFVAVVALYAKEPYFDTTKAIPAGAYETYQHVLYRTPSEKDTTLKILKEADCYNPSDPTYNLYYKKKGRDKLFNSSIWGYSDGEKLYKKVTASSLFSNRYTEIHLYPYYSYYVEYSSESPLVNGGKMSDPSTVSKTIYVINMKNGKSIPLTRVSLRQIIRDEDHELYNHFLANKGGDEQNLKYLDALNRRLPNL